MKCYLFLRKILLIFTIFSIIVILTYLIFSDSSIFHIVQAEEIVKVANNDVIRENITHTKKIDKWFWRVVVVGGVIVTVEAILWYFGYFDEEIIEIISDTEI